MLHLLNEDVLYHIFALLDVYSVLILSSVNKRLCVIASSKQVWLQIARNLSARGLLDISEAVEDLLPKDEVKRLVVGPRTWHPAPEEGPTLLRQTRVEFHHPIVDPELLQGGRYILSYGDDPENRGVQLWYTHSKRCVWSWERLGHCAFRASFDFHRDGSAVVSLACYKVAGRKYLSNYILVLQIDLEPRGAPIELFHFEMDWNVPSSHQISGDFLACFLERGATRAGSILLVNWRTEEFILFNCLRFPTGGFANYRITLTPAFALVPGYLFLARSPDGAGTRLEIYPIPFLASFWQPLSQLTSVTPSERRAFAHAISIPSNYGYNDYSHHVSVSVAECPVHEGTFDVTVEVLDYLLPAMERTDKHRQPNPLSPSFWARLRHRVSEHPPPPAPSTRPRILHRTLSRYHCRLQGSQIEFSQLSTLRHSGLYAYPSGSGYALSWDGIKFDARWRDNPKHVVVYRLGPASMGEEWRLELDLSLNGEEDGDGESPREVQMARSGAVLAVYRSKFVILHYL